MVERGDGVLRLPLPAIELGGVLVERADAFLAAPSRVRGRAAAHLHAKLATVREDGEPTRRRALRSEFTDEEWRLVSELADHPNRLLVTATPEGGETYAEVAHEAIFRRWDKLREWIAAEREFLIWRSGLEAARRAWQATPDSVRRTMRCSWAWRWRRRKPGSQSAPTDLSASRPGVHRAERHSATLRSGRSGSGCAGGRGMAALVGVLCSASAPGLPGRTGLT